MDNIRLTLDSPDLLNELCSAVSMGGSAIDFCVENNLRYDLLIAWIFDDKDRTAKYNGALEARGEWMIQRVLLELKRMSTVDVREAYNENGTLKDIASLSPELAACIAGIEVDEIFEGSGPARTWTGYTKKVKFWDKNSALEKLGKTLALFVDRHEHNHSGSITHMGDITITDESGVKTPLRFDVGSN